MEAHFNKVLEKELGVCRQAYHSQCFVGNHCKKILKGRQKVIDVLPDGGSKEEDIQAVWKTSQYLQVF